MVISHQHHSATPQHCVHGAEDGHRPRQVLRVEAAYHDGVKLANSLELVGVSTTPHPSTTLCLECRMFDLQIPFETFEAVCFATLMASRFMVSVTLHLICMGGLCTCSHRCQMRWFFRNSDLPAAWAQAQVLCLSWALGTEQICGKDTATIVADILFVGIQVVTAKMLFIGGNEYCAATRALRRPSNAW